MVKEVQISPAIAHYFAIFFSKNDRWAGRFAYHKPCEIQKNGDNFLMDFSFFAHYFSKKIFKDLFQKSHKLIIGGDMASFRLALSRVILLYNFLVLLHMTLVNIVTTNSTLYLLLQHTLAYFPKMKVYCHLFAGSLQIIAPFWWGSHLYNEIWRSRYTVHCISAV